MFLRLAAIATVLVCAKSQSDADIEAASNAVWAAGQPNFFSASDLEYDASSGGPLFTYVNEARFTGTYASLIALYDNYNLFTGSGQEENCDATCEAEVSQFLDEVVASPAMAEAINFLGQYDSDLSTAAGMKAYLDGIWFTPYTRSGGPLDSSGFEHIFLGEIDEGDLKGYHGWEKTYFDEQAGDFEYNERLDVCVPDIPKFSMALQGYSKSITSIFLRTPPEVELALYSICFRLRPGQLCDVDLDGSVQPIQTYTNNCNNNYGNSCVGSAYPRC